MIFHVGGTGNHAAAGDGLELVSPSDAVLKLLNMSWSQEDLTATEFLLVTASRIVGAFTSGSGGTTGTPTKKESGQAVSAITAEFFNTTDLTGGTKEEFYRQMWNVLLPGELGPIPEEMLLASPTDGYLLEFGTPSGATDVHVVSAWDEMGG